MMLKPPLIAIIFSLFLSGPLCYGADATPSFFVRSLQNCLTGLKRAGSWLEKKLGKTEDPSLGHGQEDIFKTSKLVKIRVLEVGDSKPLEVELENGEHGVWKTKKGNDNPKHEVAASVIDKLLRLKVVPLTVLRQFEGEDGSLQYFVRGGKNPYETMSNASRSIRFLDLIIGNTDRSGDNFLVLSDGSQVAIDNMRAFYTLDGNLPHDWVVRQAIPSREVYERYKSLSTKDLHQELDSLLGVEKVDKFISRRDRFVKVVDGWIQTEGLDKVFEEK